MSHRLILSAAVALVVSLSAGPLVAGCYRYGGGYRSGGGYYYYRAPVAAQTVTPGTTVMPPAAPGAGTTTRSYSVEPAPRYYSYSPAPSYRAAPSRSDRPQDAIINRKLHPGTFKFE